MCQKLYPSQTQATQELFGSEDNTDTEVKNTGSSSRKCIKTSIDPMDEPEIPPKLTRQLAGIYAKPIIISTEDAGTSYQDQQNLEADIDTSSQEQKNLKADVGTMTSKLEIPRLLELKPKDEAFYADLYRKTTEIFGTPHKRLGPTPTSR